VRVLLDEQLPRQLARHVAGHEVRTVQQEAWTGLTNGALLSAAEVAGFAVLVTGDRSLPFQQNLERRAIAIVVLGAVSNALEDLMPLVPGLLVALTNIQPGEVIRIEA
jgi:hypothetical protein